MAAIAFHSASPEETEERARELAARHLRAGDVVALDGALGSGKTCFVRGLARGLGCDPQVPVTSPTYTIRQDYPGPLPLVHVDLYRTGPAGLDDLGLDEETGAVIAIEWPAPCPWAARVWRVRLTDRGRRERLIRIECEERP